ncbi:DJ-1/PfpI family protein [Bacillus sp. P14.5]|uniref:DJ-1/PfpI family protein n=1 Tax=Bacillus sp. P14.5 TaxID=1983400 RepID=UPI001F05BEA3|nr:DJ-1/PfpI family protein [Bacillus sp. P14.5]
MKKTAVVLYPQFSEYEVSVALSILMQGDKPVIMCAESTSPLRGESGLTCLPDKAFHEVDISEIDSLLLPGCMDVMSLNEEAALFDFLKAAGKKHQLLRASPVHLIFWPKQVCSMEKDTRSDWWKKLVIGQEFLKKKITLMKY